jgi:hypothetical protein
MVAAPVGTRVVLVQAGASVNQHTAGVVIEERQERYLKQFVVRCDSGTIRYASANELALEGDPTRTPLGPRSAIF